MKKKQTFHKVVSLLLVMVFILSMFGDKGIAVKVAKAAATYNLYSGAGTTPVTEIDLSEGEADLRISSSDNTSLGVDFTWTVTPNNGEVVNIVEQTGAIGTGSIKGKQIKISPRRPGKATVTLQYDNGGVTSTLACDVYVGFDINTSDTDYFPIKKDGKNEVLVLDTKLNQKYKTTYQAKARNENISFVFTNSDYDMKWTTTNSRVATVSKTGEITARGAGFCKITGAGITNSSKKVEDTIEVLVLPRTYKSAEISSASEILSSHLNTHKFKPFETDGGEFYVNAAVASELCYKVYQRKGDQVLDTTSLKTMKPTDKVKLIPDTVSSKVKVDSSSRAGRYYMDTFISNGGDDKLQIENENLLYGAGYPNHVYFDIPIHFNNVLDGNTGTVRMNVNDTYSIEDNSNVQALSHFNIIDKTNRKDIISLSNGTVSALKEGTATIELTLKAEYADLYMEGAGTKYTLNVEIVDGLKLNVTEANIPVGPNVLQLSVTNNNIVDVIWSSSDKSVVTVDADGNLTGIKEGEAEITASALIDGVMKRAICKIYVYPSASKITISPDELTVFVDDVKTVKAVFEPAGITSVDLRWISLDENIATVKNETGSTRIANVTGKKAGETMIMAVSKNNIVLGTCKVRVTELISSITLSDTSVEVPLSEGTYTITATVQPSTASVRDLVWTSSNEKVATVEGGKLTLLAAGETIIAASAPGTDAETKYCMVKVTESVTGLTLASTEKVVYMGETTTIGYTVLPTTAGNKNIIWSSTKPSVATVNTSTGLITPVSVGETTIIARTVEGNFIKTCTVYVKEKAKDISIDLRDVTVWVGEEYQIPFTLDPVTSNEVSIEWTSTNSSVATISDKGVVKGLAKGSTIIMAKLLNGQFAYCNVVVEEKVEGLQLNYTKKTLYTGKYFTLKATMEPVGATNSSVTYHSSDTSICTVTSTGKVTGKKPGMAVITVTTKDGNFKDFCFVTVKQSVTSIKLNYRSYKLGYKKSFTLKATVTSTATNRTVKWTSSNPSVAKVDSRGKVTGLKYGTAWITATTQDGSGKKASCYIRVSRLVTKVSLNRYSMTVLTGNKARLTVKYTPSNATYRKVTWKSSDTSVAVVSSFGTVYAIKPGVAYITAQAVDSGKKRATCRVTVKEPVSSSSISILTDDIVLTVNQSKVMSKMMTPPTSTDSIRWTSDNEYVATVSATTGKVTGKHPGTCTVTAYTTSGKMDTAVVTVLGLSRRQLTIEQYSSHSLYLENVTRGVAWESTNISIATVDARGKVVGRKPGVATIIATYRGTKFSCKVIVKKIS